MTVSSVAVNEDRADRCGIRIADRQTSESVTAHQLVAGFGCVGSLWIGIDHAGGDQRRFHIMPAVRLRIRTRALLSERGRAREFRVETRFNFRERMNDRLAPVMPNNLYLRCLPRILFVNYLPLRFLQPFTLMVPPQKCQVSP